MRCSFGHNLPFWANSAPFTNRGHFKAVLVAASSYGAPNNQKEHLQ
jgi:hypothetical protein